MTHESRVLLHDKFTLAMLKTGSYCTVLVAWIRKWSFNASCLRSLYFDSSHVLKNSVVLYHWPSGELPRSFSSKRYLQALVNRGQDGKIRGATLIKTGHFAFQTLNPTLNPTIQNTAIFFQFLQHRTFLHTTLHNAFNDLSRASLGSFYVENVEFSQPGISGK